MGESKRKRAKRIADQQALKPATLAYDLKNKPQKAAQQTTTLPTDYVHTLPIKQTGSWRLAALSAKLWSVNYKTSLLLLVGPAVLFVAGGLLAPDINTINNKTLAGVLLASASVGLIFILVPVAYYLQVQAINGQVPGIRQTVRQGLRYFLRLAGLALLVTFLVLVGLIMFIIPGIILIRRYYLAPYYLIDQDLGIRQAMNRSAADSKAVSMYIWGVFGVLAVTTILGWVLLARIFPPFGTALSVFVTSLFVFLPALRYREVAMRKSAGSLFKTTTEAPDAQR